MPDIDTAADAKKTADSSHSMLRWILGGIGAGLVAIGFFAQVAFNTFMTRDEAQQNFLRQDLKAGIDKMSQAMEKVDDKNELLVRAIDNQTRMIEGLRDDTRQGVWRSVEPPPTLPAK
jgi:hypothetical protein